MIEKENIPGHWRLESLGNICKTTSGGTPSRKVQNYYNGNIPWVKSGELDNGLIMDTEEKITESAVTNSSAKIFPKGTLLIALYGASIGKISFLGIDAATNQAICGIFQSPEINHKFLFYFLSYSRPNLVKQGIGGAQPNISQGILKNLMIPIPPLAEQSQIVEKIEELFSDLDVGRRLIEAANEQLKTYRTEVLKWSFKEGSSFNNQQLVLPEDWSVVELGKVCDTASGGTPDRRNKQYFMGVNKWVKSGELNSGIIIDTEEKISDEAMRNSNAKVFPKGTLLIALYGATVGKMAFLGTDAATNQAVCALLNTSQINSKFLYYYLILIRPRLIKESIGGAQKNISQGILKKLRIPLPPYNTQIEKVEYLDYTFSLCDMVESRIESSLNQTEALKQSILKKAFEGKLVKSQTT